MTAIGTITAKMPAMGSTGWRLWDTISRWLPRGDPLPADIWRTRHHGVIVLLWLHAAVIVGFGLAQGYGVVHSTLEAGVVAAIAVLASVRGPNRTLRTLVGSFG